MKLLLILVMFLLVSCEQKEGASSEEDTVKKAPSVNSFSSDVTEEKEIAVAVIEEAVLVELVDGDYNTGCIVTSESTSEEHRLLIQEDSLDIFIKYHTSNDCGALMENLDISYYRDTHEFKDTRYIAQDADLYYSNCGMIETAGQGVDVDEINCFLSYEDTSIEFLEISGGYSFNGFDFY